MKPKSWTDHDSGSEVNIGFLRLYVWYQMTEDGLDRWAFSFAGRKSEPRYASRESAKLAGLRFAKKFMTEAVSIIEQMDGYSDPPERGPKDPAAEADAQAEREWIASLFTAGLEG